MGVARSGLWPPAAAKLKSQLKSLSASAVQSMFGVKRNGAPQGNGRNYHFTGRWIEYETLVRKKEIDLWCFC